LSYAPALRTANRSEQAGEPKKLNACRQVEPRKFTAQSGHRRLTFAKRHAFWNRALLLNGDFLR